MGNLVSIKLALSNFGTHVHGFDINVGSADTARDPRGFAVKFYTEDGIWDLVGNNTPVFFIRDPILFSSFIHTQKRNPQTHLKDPDMMWDFHTLRPESIHQFMFLFGDRGGLFWKVRVFFKLQSVFIQELPMGIGT